MDQLHFKIKEIIANKIKRPFELHIYGSYASGLSLPTSDVDFLLEIPEDINGNYYLDILEDEFRQNKIFQEVKYIKSATIPVLKLMTTYEFECFKVDITIKDLNHYGLNCVGLV